MGTILTLNLWVELKMISVLVNLVLNQQYHLLTNMLVEKRKLLVHGLISRSKCLQCQLNHLASHLHVNAVHVGKMPIVDIVIVVPLLSTVRNVLIIPIQA